MYAGVKFVEYVNDGDCAIGKRMLELTNVGHVDQSFPLCTVKM